MDSHSLPSVLYQHLNRKFSIPCYPATPNSKVHSTQIRNNSFLFNASASSYSENPNKKIIASSLFFLLSWFIWHCQKQWSSEILCHSAAWQKCVPDATRGNPIHHHMAQFHRILWDAGAWRWRDCYAGGGYNKRTLSTLYTNIHKLCKDLYSWNACFFSSFSFLEIILRITVMHTTFAFVRMAFFLSLPPEGNINLTYRWWVWVVLHFT